MYIAYDRDDAGNSAAAKLSEELMGIGIECFRVQFPKGMDVNEYALKTQPASKALGVLLTGAAWMGKGPRPAGRAQVPIAAPTVHEPTAKEKESEVQVPEPIIEPPPAETKTAAKEKIIEI